MAEEKKRFASKSTIENGNESTNLSLNDVLISQHTTGDNNDKSVKILQAQLTPYGTSATASATATKTVTMVNFPDDFTALVGTKVRVKFTYSNTASTQMYLKVGSLSAKPCTCRGVAMGSGSVSAGAELEFCYNGTSWDCQFSEPISAVDTTSKSPVNSTALNGALANYNFIKNKSVLFIGDSYGDSSAISNPWYPLVIADITFKNVYRLTTGGHGFTGKDGATSGTTGTTLMWKTDLTNWVNSQTSNVLSSITDVYIIGGFNDIYSTEETILSYMSEFFTYAKSVLPNANYHLGMSGWADAVNNFSTPNQTFTGIVARYTLSTVVAKAYRQCSHFGCSYMGDLFLALHNYGVDFDSSYYHPSSYGARKLANAIINYILGRNINIGTDEIEEVFTVTDSSNTSVDNGYFYCRQKDNLIQVSNFTNSPNNIRNAISLTTKTTLNKGYNYVINTTNFDKLVKLKKGLFVGKSGNGSCLLKGDIASGGDTYDLCYLFIDGSNILNVIPTKDIASATTINIRIRSELFMAESC